MKSFILAVFLLLTVSIFVTYNAGKTVAYIDEMLQLADALPKNQEAFINSGPIDDTVIALITLWDQKFPVIVCTAGYANTNRCDEAIGALSIHFQNQSGADFAVALSEFCDGLSRLRILEGLNWEGIF